MDSLNDKLVNRDKIITSKIARIIIMGVYILAADATNVSVLAFLSVAFSTKLRILATVLLQYNSVTFISIILSKFILPDKTLSPLLTITLLLSPVKLLLSNLDVQSFFENYIITKNIYFLICLF